MALRRMQDPRTWGIVDRPGPPSDRSVDLAKLRDRFTTAGIPTDRPGFLDDPRFLALEQQDRYVLEDYARFTRWGQYDATYLDRAEKVIRIVVQEMHGALQRDANHGACVNASMVLSRILDRERIWNYMVNGALTIEFPAGSGFETFQFWPIDEDPGPGRTTGHKWVSATPFEVIDLTLRLQNYPTPFTDLLPDTVLESNPGRAEIVFSDLAAPGYFEECVRHKIWPLDELDAMWPNFRRSLSPDFPAAVVTDGGVTLKYVPTGIGASDEPLERMGTIRFEGRSPLEFYNEVVVPRLGGLAASDANE